MNTLTLDEVIHNIRDLPSLPTVVAELLTNMNQEDIDIKILAGKIALDQALTAKTLRLSNSSFYGMQRQVTTLEQAITILGFHSVRSLVIATAVTGSFQEIKVPGFNFSGFWRHSIASAVCAKVLARHCRNNQESAFIAGLLHDIGRLVLVTGFPRQYSAVLAYRAAHDCSLPEAEQAVLGINDAQVGYALARHWKFPEKMQNAVADHHGINKEEKDPLTAIVHVADVIAHALDFARDEEDMVPPLCAAAWNSLHINEEGFMQICKDTESQFDEVSKILLA